MNKKIIIICNCSSGLNDFRGMLIDELILQNNNVCAVIPYSNVDEELSAEMLLVNRGCKLIKVSIERRKINLFSDMKLLLSYRKIIRKLHPDIVITYTIKPNIYGGISCQLTRTPYIMNITGLGTAFEKKGVLKSIVTMMYRIACKRASVVFFENEENRLFFIQERIATQMQTHRLNGAGVDLEKFQVAKYPEGECVRFLFMGRIMAEKGIDELFSAMRMLVSNGIKCELHVLGGYEEYYEEIVREYEEEGWLHYHGFQKDVRPYIENCHCFVLPSWHEGMANTNLESAAVGRPIITSNIHGCLEAVIEGKSGYLVEPKNVKSLYSAMKRFSELPYEERKNMGLRGRKLMEEVFDKRNVVEETIRCMFQKETK